MSLRPSRCRAPRPVLVVLAVLTLGAAGCPKPPPPPPQPEPEQVAPPPPPKCEAFSEKCASKPDTKAKVTNSDLVLTPPAGWIYAQQSSATVAQSGDAGPAIAMLGVDVDAKDVKKAAATKDAALAELVKQLGLAPLKTKIAWKVPAQSKPLGAFTLQQWQLTDKAGARGAKKGDLLVVAVQIADGKVVLGLGFVPDDDKSDADVAIMRSVESLGKAQ